MSINIFESKAFKFASDTDKLLFILHENPRISKKRVCDMYCYLVTSVTFVPFNNNNLLLNNNNNNNVGYRSNNNNKVTSDMREDYLILNKVKTYLSRLRKAGKVHIDKSENPPVYELTTLGANYVKTGLRLEQQESEKVEEQKRLREETEKLIQYDKDYYRRRLGWTQQNK